MTKIPITKNKSFESLNIGKLGFISNFDIRISNLRNKFLPVILSCLSSLLLLLSFPKFDLWFLSFVGLLPLFFVIKGKRPLISFLFSYLTGFLFFLATIYWLIHVTLLGYVLLVFYLAVYFGIFGFLVAVFQEKPALLKIFLFPSIWVILEFLRSHILTGFGWAILGYSQYKILPIIQFADITGAYGVSFLIVMVNVAIFEILSSRNLEEKFLISSLTIITLISVLTYGSFKLGQKTVYPKLRVSLIQGNIPQEIKWEEKSWENIFHKYANLSRKANLDKPDVIIWPETAFPGFFKGNAGLSKKVLTLSKELKTDLLLGAITLEDSSIYNSAILASSDGKISEIYRKLHLVPFGEYVPLRGLFGFLPQLAVLGDFTPGKEYTIFSLNKDPAEKIATLICFEDTIPELSRQFVLNGANLLVNITNDAWFKDTSAPYQHLQASVLRAVENRAPVVRAANTGISGFIEASGRITDKISLGQKETFISGYKTQEVKLRNELSFYSSWGDLFVLLCIIIFVFGNLKFKRQNV